MSTDFIVIGHRGAAGLAPENTLAAFEKAIELGVDMVELDVHLTADRRLAVIHDDTVNRTTDGTGRVESMSLAEIRRLDAGASQRVPSLEEVLEAVGRRCRVNVELKGEDTEEAASKVLMQFVGGRLWRYADFLVSSFAHGRLRSFQAFLPDVPLGVLFDELPEDFVAVAQSIGAGYANLSREQATPQNVAEANGAGLQVLVYTVDTAREARHFKRIGAAGVFTDFPDRVWG